MVNNEDFARRLNKIMDSHQVSASSFAEKIDVGRSSISHILSGRNKPSLEFVLKIINRFPEVDLHWLITGRENPGDQVKPEEPNRQRTAPPSKVEPQIDHGKAPARPSSKSIEKVVILYRDGSFDAYAP